MRLGVVKEMFIKCRFYYYSGVVRPAGGETTALAREFVTHSPRERRGTAHPGGHTQKHLGLVGLEAEEVRGNCGHEPLMVSAGKNERASRVRRFGIRWCEWFLKAQGQRGGPG